MRMKMLARVAAVAAAVFSFRGVAQEVVSNEVSLGSALFMADDLENLNDAVELTKEQREAALDLMRGAMSRARAISLGQYRDMTDYDWPEDEDDQQKWQEAWQNKAKKMQEEVAALEKSVMSDLQALLEPEQIESGWSRFERSRRRLLLRTVPTVLAAMQSNGMGHAYMFGPFGRESVSDVVALVRACKPGAQEWEALRTSLEQYESATDALIVEWRPFAKKHGHQDYWSMHNQEEQASDADRERAQDLVKRMRQAEVRACKAVEGVLTGETKEKFLRKRLRAEMQWSWMQAVKMPQVRAVLKLRSLSASQKADIDAIVKKADKDLMALAVQSLHERDEEVLLDKKPETNEYGMPMDVKTMERQRQENKIRRQMVKDVLALLSSEQRAAYDTGIENDEDLAKAFKKRRTDDGPWGYGVDEALAEEWDVYNQRDEDEEE
ncbi:MAG TPA: hypothetical protein VD971_05975 [Phycisphaerales bacterium]|nr:hypothetical protein [Phycisphaerales bacterium]